MRGLTDFSYRDIPRLGCLIMLILFATIFTAVLGTATCYGDDNYSPPPSVERLYAYADSTVVHEAPDVQVVAGTVPNATTVKQSTRQVTYSEATVCTVRNGIRSCSTARSYDGPRIRLFRRRSQ